MVVTLCAGHTHFVDVSWVCVGLFSGYIVLVYEYLFIIYKNLYEYLALVVTLCDGHTHFVDVSWVCVGLLSGYIGLVGGVIGLFG